MNRSDGAGQPPEVVVVGPFPPPVHGMSAVTGFIADSLSPLARVTKADISPLTLSPGPLQKAVKGGRVLWALLRIVVRRLASARRLYLPSAHGLGVSYTAALVWLARMLGYRVFIHHHSFAYIDATVWRMKMLTRIAGPHVVHIFLCDRMRKTFFERYPAARSAAVVSNAAYIELSTTPGHPRHGALRLGHMSNLSEEKGLTKVIDVTRRLASEGRDVQLVLAGPFMNAAARQQVDRAMVELGEVLDYRGPVYGADKARFFSDIDVFLFPSLYAQEAQPIVVFEAMAHGVPTISYARSCIEEALEGGGGIALPLTDDFAARAHEILEIWIKDDDLLDKARAKAIDKAQSHKRHADTQFDELLHAICRRQE